MDHIDTIERDPVFSRLSRRDCFGVRYIDRRADARPTGLVKRTRSCANAPDEDRIIGERQEIRLSVGGFVMLRRRLPVSRGTY